MKRYLWILLAAPWVGVAQVPSGLTTPTLGYVYDSDAQSLRVVEGVPGAAVLGDALHLDATFDSMAVAPNRRYALAGRSGDANLFIVRLDGRSGVAAASGMPASRGFFSPSGGTVALATSGVIAIWGGLPDNPTLLRTVAFSELTSSTKLAVADDGGVVVALTGGSLWRLDDAPVAIGDGFADMQFLRGTEDLAALAQNRVMVFHKASADATNDLATLDFPGVALAFSRDERSIAVLGTDSVQLIRLDTGDSVSLPLDNIQPAGLWRTEGNSVFQLTSGAASDIWLLDGDATAPRLTKVETRNGAAQ